MILVKLIDRTIFENDINLGMNLDKVGIEDCLLESGEID